jgi:pyridoxamine 5'-phosphate oxidase
MRSIPPRIPKDPLQEFNRWYRAAKAAGLRQPETVAMATADSRGRPSARMVLYKGMSPDGGFRVFTNYSSRKARELSKNPWTALVFFWIEHGRQVRVEGKAVRLSAAENDEYWRSRVRLSQIGAWASHQSEELPDRSELLKRVREFTRRFKNQEIPRPPHWGGYRIVPERMEFWFEKPGRLHRRIQFTRSKSGTRWRGIDLNP